MINHTKDTAPMISDYKMGSHANISQFKLFFRQLWAPRPLLAASSTTTS